MYKKIMTVVVALKDKENDTIYFGCDGQGTMGDISLNWGNKIITKTFPIVNEEDRILEEKTMYIGVSGSHYLQSYLTHAYTPPGKLTDENFVDYLYNQFFQKLNNDLSEHKLLANVDGVLESEAGMIIVFDGEIYSVYSDFSIVRLVNRDFACTGSGWEVASSVLTNLLNYHDEMNYKDILSEALLTTGELNVYCDKNINILEIFS